MFGFNNRKRNRAAAEVRYPQKRCRPSPPPYWQVVKSWICLSCRTENAFNEVHCKCSRTNPCEILPERNGEDSPPYPGSTSGAKDWKCTSCTRENNKVEMFCVLCTSSRPAGDVQEETWRCGQCTLINPATKLRCQLCENYQHPS
jgi:hypothetical protein